MRTAKIGLLVTVAAALLWAAGCGSNKKQGSPLPAQQASALQRELDSVKRRFDFGDGACRDIQNRSKPDVQSILASIPAGVGSDVRSSLRQSFDRLWELAATQCDETRHEQTTPRTTPQPTPTTPTETQTQTQTETTPTETQTQPQKPKKRGKDNGTGGDQGGAPAPRGD
jgi:hypothetical protein